MRENRSSIFAVASHCLAAADPAEKIVLTHAAAASFLAGELPAADDGGEPPAPIANPGRPYKPRLVPPHRVPARGIGSGEGRAAFIHAIAHIEFNAINLAWDAVYRFRGMPDAYYRDWVQVADDEARHFQLLEKRLGDFGCRYGDFDAHDGLWEMAVKTAHNGLERMALVPRVLEARGLDVSPGMIVRLEQAGDFETAELLKLILREEVAHVAAGSRWFRWYCEREGRDPEETFAALLARHGLSVRGPLNSEARLQAGFSEGELMRLTTLEQTSA